MANNMRHWLCCDGGGTKLLILLIDEELGVVSAATAGGVNPNFISEENIRKNMDSCIRAVMDGYTGLHLEHCYVSMTCPVHFIQEALIDNGVRAEVTTVGEGLMGILAGLCVDKGFTALSGTGSDVFYEGPPRRRMLGGWGILLGDEGSGGHIGQKGIIAAIHAMDGRGEPTLLADELMEWLYPGEREGEGAGGCVGKRSDGLLDITHDEESGGESNGEESGEGSGGESGGKSGGESGGKSGGKSGGESSGGNIKGLGVKFGERTIAVGGSEKLKMSDLTKRIYAAASPRGVLASFAPIVSKAWGNGDKVAGDILATAGEDMGKQMVALIRRVLSDNPDALSLPSSLCGGTWKGARRIYHAYRDYVWEAYPDFIIKWPLFDAVAGGAVLTGLSLGYSGDEIRARLSRTFKNYLYPAEII